MIDFTKYPIPRMRHHTAPTLYLPMNRLRVQPSWYPPLRSDVDWNEYFHNGKEPEILDIGCGRGALLLRYSLQFPDVNILGVELRQQAVEWIASVIEGEQLPNVAAWWYSGANGFPFIRDKSLSRCFYFFPDPWMKTKHFKRRLFSISFLDELARILEPGGMLHLMTDVPEVDEFQIDLLQEHGKWDISEIEDENKWNLPLTDQEKFSLRKNIPYTRKICTLL